MNGGCVCGFLFKANNFLNCLYCLLANANHPNFFYIRKKVTFANKVYDPLAGNS